MDIMLNYHDFLNEQAKDPCLKNYKQIGIKKDKDKIVPNYVKVNESSDKNFDRVDYYLGYYKNLSPNGFQLERSGNSIVISVPYDTSIETVAGLQLPIVFK